MKNVIEFQSVNKSVKTDSGQRIQLLSDVSFAVPEGQITGFIGLNGAGKTTSLKVLLEFLQRDSGKILYGGEAEFSSDFRKRLGYMPERPYFYDFLTAKEFLQLHLRLLKIETAEHQDRIIKVLEKVRLLDAKDKRLKDFSKGMLQRIGIAQAIINDPDILLFDEPMSGLDPLGRSLVRKVMIEHAERGGTLFFSSHLLQDMQELCQKCIVIHKGKIKFEGPVSGLMGAQSLEQSFLQMIGEV